MPHERIYSIDQDPDHTNNVQVAWGHPSSPCNTGPGNEDGHVMIVVERPGTPARTAASVEETTRRLIDLLSQVNLKAGAGAIADRLVKLAGEDLSYAFGGQLELLAVQLDRKGCNRAIEALRRGRNVAFGKDE